MPFIFFKILLSTPKIFKLDLKEYLPSNKLSYAPHNKYKEHCIWAELLQCKNTMYVHSSQTSKDELASDAEPPADVNCKFIFCVKCIYML